MYRRIVLISSLFLLFSLYGKSQSVTDQQKKLAERLLRSVYGGQPSGIDELISDNIVSSYPIFEQIFKTKAIRGREAFKNFANHFSKKWKDPEITIHERIGENNKVVFIWSFSATMMNDDGNGNTIPGESFSWGGFTYYEFDESNKINLEIGEESTPGPFSRLKVADSAE